MVQGMGDEDRGMFSYTLTSLGAQTAHTLLRDERGCLEVEGICHSSHSIKGSIAKHNEIPTDVLMH